MPNMQKNEVIVEIRIFCSCRTLQQAMCWQWFCILYTADYYWDNMDIPLGLDRISQLDEMY
jgi:hypothetical protein